MKNEIKRKVDRVKTVFLLRRGEVSSKYGINVDQCDGYFELSRQASDIYFLTASTVVSQLRSYTKLYIMYVITNTA